MWFGTKDGLNKFDGYSFKTYRREENKASLRNNVITCLAEDGHNTLWIGTEKGISCYDPVKAVFSDFDVKTPDNDTITEYIRALVPQDRKVWILTGNRLFVYHTDRRILERTDFGNGAAPSALCIDTDGMTWVWLEGYGLVKHLPHTGGFVPVYRNDRLSVSALSDYRNNFLLIGTRENGLFRLNKRTGDCRKIELDRDIPRLFVRDIEQITPANAWIGTENGIYIYNEHTVTHLIHNPFDDFSLADNAVYSVYKDREDGIWIGTYFGGTGYIPKGYSFFEKYYPLANRNSINGNRIREFCEDKAGNLYIATEDAGINYLDTHTGKFTYITRQSHPVYIGHYNIQCLSLYGDELWVGTFNKGIDVVDLKRKQTRHYEKRNTPYSLNNNDIFAIYTDKNGTTWIGTSSELAKYDREKDGFITMKEFGSLFVSDIQEDRNGYLWLATYNVGAVRYNPRTGEIKHFGYDPADSTTICYDKITTIFEDSRHTLWFGSEDGGLCSYNEQTESFRRITTRHGLPSNVVHKILEDDKGTFWISTNNGLAHYHPETGEIRNFNSSNGLLSKQFNYNSGIKAHNGRLYFGCIDGMIAFNPEEFKKNEYKPAVVLTDFQVFNTSVPIREKGSPLQKSVSFTDTIRLDYKQSSFGFSFSALSYTASEMNRYAYKLNGIDKDWVYPEPPAKASYSNIRPGKYVFEVKASNDNGEWSDKITSVCLLVAPPWWETGWAYCLYVLLAGGILYGSVCLYLRKIRLSNERRNKILERKRKEEIYSAKIDFFTNIAHEIRTPLTLIKAPLDYILSTEPDKNELSENLRTMERNTGRLLVLINQLLDFRKVESKVFSLQFEDTDMNDLVNGIYVRFKTTAEQKGMRMEMQLPEAPVIVSVDKEAMTKVCSNLFTNAIKYARSFIRVSVTPHAERSCLEIRVDNDGAPIPAELREKIFEAFFQIDDRDKVVRSGSGIGLALARSLIRLHKGQIFVDSNRTAYTSFVVHIPLQRTGSGITGGEPAEEPEITAAQTPEETAYGNRTTLLVVEDNEDLQAFLSEKLSRQFAVLKANNGAEALEMMEKHKISLVVSDIIMPIMDGVELCKNIKSDLQTCHIPVILLTAKTNLNSKIEGLKSGADAYIEKPFSLPHLTAQIFNLLENHEKLRKNFATNPFIATSTMARTKADEVFLNKLTGIVRQHMEEENFSVDELAAAMNMSRTSLHRKIKGIADLTPGDFIRLVRLKKAAELLREGEYRVNEICILVGFRSQSYFTKSFYRQFGVLPKDFLKKINQKAD